MKKKFFSNTVFEMIMLVILIIMSLALIATTTVYVFKSTHQLHTYQNVAIYNHGVITDEDGEIFKKNFDVPDNSVVLVTYDNKNTVTRLDDEPIKLEIVR